ncbi:MAG TPA: hypothetical protein PLO65_14545 [Caulobacter sp.]|nr:hypothetical protein [Caulobacter sp.]
MDKFDNILALISAAGAFGIAAYGLVEALGKAIAWRGRPSRFSKAGVFGLPFVGFNEIRKLAGNLEPALRRTYGPDFMDILVQQYRNGRSKGEAPSTLRQGTLLALPFMPPGEVAGVIDNIWGMGGGAAAIRQGSYADRLALALTEEKAANESARDDFTPTANDAALAGRFTAALDTRIQAAFAVAEESYGAVLRLWSGIAAIGLAVSFNSITGGQMLTLVGIQDPEPLAGFIAAAIFGAVSVPLAPVANDIVSALSEAMKAWRSVSAVKRT